MVVDYQISNSYNLDVIVDVSAYNYFCMIIPSSGNIILVGDDYMIREIQNTLIVW